MADLPEQKLWRAYINRIVEDAIYPFSLHKVKKSGGFMPIEEQYKKFTSGKWRYTKGFSSMTTASDHYRAITIVACESFVDVCIDAGYDSLFARKSRDLVKKANSYKKELDKLFDEKKIGQYDPKPKKKNGTKKCTVLPN